jgi:2-hydroxychromene-2-carboxylate isomerase
LEKIMEHAVDVFWSFRSPYSYLATPDMLSLRDDYVLDVNFRPVLPIAVRAKESLFTGDKRPVQYILNDFPRRAEFLGMPCKFPSPDPIVQNMETFEVADEQPYIYRLTGLGIEAARRGRGLELAYHVSRLIWGGVSGWDQGEHLANAVAEAGLDLAELESALIDNDPMPEIKANQDALDASGHWGVPTFVFNGEPFFGQDRVETLRWRLDQVGVPRR